MSSRNLLTPAEVAKQLRLKRADRVYELINSGELTASNISKGIRPRWVIRQEEVDKLIDRNETEARPVSTRRRDSHNYGEVPQYV